MKLNAEFFEQYSTNVLTTEESRAFQELLANDPHAHKAERAFRRVFAAERLARHDDDSLPATFENSVIRRIRVAPPPQADGTVSLLSSALSSFADVFLGRPRFIASACMTLLVLLWTPALVLRYASTSPEAQQPLALYDAQREQPYTRLVNAVTARIPEGYRAVSLEVAGFAFPGDRVDVMWLYQSQKNSTATMVARDVQVLSTQHQDAEMEDSIGQSTVTLLVPAADSGKIELARSTGQIALSIRSMAEDLNRRTQSSTVPVAGETSPTPLLDFLGPDGQVERYIVRNGRLVPRI